MSGRFLFKKSGFTIVELLVVIVVIGILAAITVVAYRGITGSANDNAVLSDLESVDTAQTDYSIQTKLVGKAWYSATGIDTNLKFTPSKGNVIDVVINSTDYCIRVYNPNSATYKTLAAAATKGSSNLACAAITASSQALVDSGVPPTYTTSFESGLDGWSSGHSNNTLSNSTTTARTGSRSIRSVQNTFWYTNNAAQCGSPTTSCGFTGDGIRKTVTGLTIGQPYVFSAYVYTTESNRVANWNPITGASGAQAQVPLVPNQWTRIQHTITPTATSVYVYLDLETTLRIPSEVVTTFVDDITVP